jgi:hypothetical protein
MKLSQSEEIEDKRGEKTEEKIDKLALRSEEDKGKLETRLPPQFSRMMQTTPSVLLQEKISLRSRTQSS